MDFHTHKRAKGPFAHFAELVDTDFQDPPPDPEPDSVPAPPRYVRDHVLPPRALLRHRLKNAHYVDSYFGPVLDDSGSIGFIATIPQGNSQVERVGRRVVYKSLQIHSYLTLPSGVPTAPLHATVWVIYDREARGALPSMSDIFSNSVAFGIGFNNDNNSARFRILFRRSYGLDYQQSALPIEEFISLQGLDTIWSGSGGTIASVVSGSLLVAVASPEPTASASTQKIGFLCSTRIRFINAP